jgi:hypothetical protein
VSCPVARPIGKRIANQISNLSHATLGGKLASGRLEHLDAKGLAE